MDEQVIILSDNKALVRNVKKICSELKVDFIEAESTSDLYALPFFFAIVDPEKIEKEFFESFEEIFELEDPKKITVFLTRDVSKIRRKIKKFFVVNAKEEIDMSDLKTLLQNKKITCQKHKTDSKSYDKRLFRMFFILRKLLPKNSYIKIPDLCKEFNVSQRTIRRDIELMRMAGEDIEYNKSKNGYVLNGSISGISQKEY